MLSLAGCSKQEIKPEQQEPSQPDATAPEETAEAAPAAVPESETAPENADSAAGTGLTGNSVLDPKPASALAQLETNVEVTKQETVLGETRDTRKTEEKSWFAGLQCERYTGEKQGTFGTGTKHEDAISFRFTNNDNREYNLTWANAYSRIGADEATNVPIKLAINGNRLTNEQINACCGTMIVKAGQTLECNRCPASLRYPETHKFIKEKQEMINSVEARSRFVSTQTDFKCRT